MCDWVFNHPTKTACTEDGVTICKLYVGNLPPNTVGDARGVTAVPDEEWNDPLEMSDNVSGSPAALKPTTRTKLTKLFEPFGKIKHFWITKADVNEKKKPYAFVTYASPECAYKALTANAKRFTLDNTLLFVRPADSWHQPKEESKMKLRDRNNMKIKKTNPSDQPDCSMQVEGNASSSVEEEPPTILDILNRDCLINILSYVSINDLIKSEDVSSRWKDMVLDYLLLTRSYSTSTWNQGDLTTGRLRNLLQRIGPNLKHLNINHYGYCLNNRTVRTITKYCPNLETFLADSMEIRNWNDIAIHCKKLHSIKFLSCNELTDKNLSSLLSIQSAIRNVTLTSLENIDGTFIKKIKNNLTHLKIHGCRNFNDSNICDNVHILKSLTFLWLSKIEFQPATLKSLSALTNLEELHLHSSVMHFGSTRPHCVCSELGEAVKCMPNLKTITLIKYSCFHDELLVELSQYNNKLAKLDICGVYAHDPNPEDAEFVSVNGLKAIAVSCKELIQVNISNHINMDELVLALASSASLQYLEAKNGRRLSDNDVKKCIQKCHNLQFLNLSGCTQITTGIIAACVEELMKHPRKMMLLLGGTDAEDMDDPIPTHPQLEVSFKVLEHPDDDIDYASDCSFDMEIYDYTGSDFDSDQYLSDADVDEEDVWEAVHIPLQLMHQFGIE